MTLNEWECDYCGFITDSEKVYDEHTETHVKE